MVDRACRNEPVNLFVSDNSDRYPTRLRQMCADCPVRQQCLDMALEDPSLKGLWGGMNEAERRGERRRRGIEHRRGGQPSKAKCGEPAGYKAHLRYGETPCDACTEAYSAYNARTHARRRTATAAA
jgi:WhiB family redox-sensing transcriptional regulator